MKFNPPGIRNDRLTFEQWILLDSETPDIGTTAILAELILDTVGFPSRLFQTVKSEDTVVFYLGLMLNTHTGMFQLMRVGLNVGC